MLILAAGALADPLKRAVEGAGAVAILCTAASQEEAVAAIDAAEAQGAVRHLIVATPWADGLAGWPANSVAGHLCRSCICWYRVSTICLYLLELASSLRLALAPA